MVAYASKVEQYDFTTNATAAQNACWEIPNPWNCIRWMQASRFEKTLFQHSAGVRSHHGIVMIAGLGIASQQANEHSRILTLRVNLAFVRTKALLAGIGSINKDSCHFLWNDTENASDYGDLTETHCLKIKQRVYFDIVN